MTGFVAHLARAYPLATATLVILLILAGVADGVGVAALLPLLELATGESASSDSVLARAADALILGLGLEPTLPVLLVLLVIAMAAQGVFRWLAMKRTGYTVARVAADLRLRLLRALMAARWTYFVSQPTGSLSNAMSRDARSGRGSRIATPVRRWRRSCSSWSTQRSSCCCPGASPRWRCWPAERARSCSGGSCG